MNYFRILILLGLLTLALTLKAQNHQDALRYSERFYTANARTAAMGNAYGALGANTLAPSINPAGLGFYRSNEFSLTTGFQNKTTEADYLNTTSEDRKYNINLGNIGLVFTDVQYKLGKPVKDDWAGYTFAIGINRTNSFHKRNLLKGTNKNTTILNDFVERAEGRFPTDLLNDDFTTAGQAYSNWLINPNFPDSSSHFASMENAQNPNVDQTNTITSSGAMNDIYMAFGANYANKLYFGATVAFPTVDFQQTNKFREVNNDIKNANLNDSIPNYEELTYKEEINTSGTGIMGGIGIIARPLNFIRIGASVYSPTFYSLSDNYSYEMQAKVRDRFDGSTYEDNIETEGKFEYKVSTPLRFLGSLAFIIGKTGIISFDYEFKDYTNAKLSSEDYQFTPENETIRSIYQPVHNFKIGTEWRYKMFYFRGGYGYYGSPTNNNLVSNDKNQYSLGLGLKDGSYAFDLAYQLTTTESIYEPYELDSGGGPVAKNTTNHHNFMFTFTYDF